MSDIAIRVDGLSKQYRIGGKQERYKTLRDTLTDALAAPFRRFYSVVRGQSSVVTDETIWALKDVSFEVKRGEVVGIIGRNGAGKSTLLKILSRITEPTEGAAEIHGRVGSLLEVGTGFHPELTGRENVYLNGAILGMQRTEIERKFDKIVTFAEIEKFLDTPVKHYSSGMYVRLAFAVAAHLEPEILLVDEVLAVGDAAFQKKCLGKMGDVAKEGRTVLFVSHNMAAVQSLCTRAIWLHEGKIVEEGQPSQVVSSYLQTSFSNLTEQVWNDMITAPGNETVRLHRVCVHPVNGASSDQITMETPFVIEVEYWNLAPEMHLHITLHLHNEQGVTAFATWSSIGGDPLLYDRPPAGLFRAACHAPGNLLNSGMYRVLLMVVRDRKTTSYQYEDAVSFEVLDTYEGRGSWYGKVPGVVRPMLEWTIDHVDGGSEAAIGAGEKQC